MGRAKQLKGNPRYERDIEGLDHLPIHPLANCKATHIPRHLKRVQSFHACLTYQEATFVCRGNRTV